MTLPFDRPVLARDGAPPAPPRDTYAPSLGLDVLLTGDLMRSADILPGEPTEDCTVYFDDATGAEDEGQGQPNPDAEFGAGRRGFGRYRLAHNVIRVQVFADDRKPAYGRMTNASVTGFFVRCQAALPFRSVVRVEWVVMNDMKMEFLGKVVRSTAQGMAIHLHTDDTNWRFRASFIDLCRSPTNKPPCVVVHKLTPAEARRLEEDDHVLRRLGQQWKQIERDPRDDGAHQRFIQLCLQERKLQFALERYREQQLRPEADFDPTPYLKQIGTILTFYQVRSGPEASASPLKRYLPVLIVVFLIVVLLMAVPYMVGSRVTPPS